mmetsp:Transcript_3824/g.8447  ORF Transcript_3824/g.8447 Transcript_3824/m.8447 type:complete len:867 (+) Transcript_3824:469-3069(+)
MAHQRHGRRPTNYTTSYTPPPSLVEHAARARASINNSNGASIVDVNSAISGGSSSSACYNGGRSSSSSFPRSSGDGAAELDRSVDSEARNRAALKKKNSREHAEQLTREKDKLVRRGEHMKERRSRDVVGRDGSSKEGGYRNSRESGRDGPREGEPRSKEWASSKNSSSSSSRRRSEQQQHHGEGSSRRVADSRGHYQSQSSPQGHHYSPKESSSRNSSNSRRQSSSQQQHPAPTAPLSSGEQRSTTNNKSSRRQELTEQQIAEYAGKRALMRLEQEFSDAAIAKRENRRASLSPTNSRRSIHGGGGDDLSHYSHNSHNASSNFNSSVASSNFNNSSASINSQPQMMVTSVMDRKKLNRVPQVNKRDLIIGEYLGRGNFCDVFEVTWIPEGSNNIYAASGRGGGLRSSFNGRSSFRDSQASDNTYSNSDEDDDYHDEAEADRQRMEIMSLACSNDLRPTLGNRGSSLRSISQIRTTSSPVYTNKSLTSNDSSSFRNPNVLALKCLRPAVRAQPRKFVIGAEDLAHETALLACLDHPNIIQLYGRAEGCFSTAFQFGSSKVSGQSSGSSHNRSGKQSTERSMNDGYFIILDKLMTTLTDRIDEWKDECRAITGVDIRHSDDMDAPLPLPPQESNLTEHLYKRLKVGYCIADALEYLHSRHVVFRDLKPANVGFDCNDCVKMFDFGFATSIAPLLNQQYQSGQPQQGYGPLTETCGTRRYMAPEVALKLGYGHEVDVYSFGMLLWEICAMEKPFDSIQSVEDFHDIVVLCGKRPPLNIDPLWTKSLKNLMVRCWSTDPLDRPSMMQVKSMLCDVLRDMNIKAMEKRGGSSGNESKSKGGDGGSSAARGRPAQQPPPNFINKWRRRVSI